MGGHSKLLENNGFKDSWRELYPDPTTHMGATWPSEAHNICCTSWAKDADERDRIDFIYHNGDCLRPKTAHLVGPRGYFKRGEQVFDEGESPFLEATTDLPW